MTDELRSALADRYTLESEVGRGGMAVVFSARDLRHRRRVAIKVMSPEASAARTSDRFRQEIEVTAGLSHPHIVPLFDSGEVAGQLYFVMPLIEGETLRTRLLREGRLSLKDATHITREIAEALDFAHARGVVHRDVKPENILLANGHALLADFGIARASSGTSGLTGTGMFIGTPEYLSPECIIGDSPAGAPADVYALGCVVFEMLAGAPPFRGPTQQATLARRLTGLIPSVRDARPEVPPGIAAAITSALATDPAQRCPTCAALAAELASGVAHERGEPLSDVSLVVRPFQAVGETAELGDFADGLTDEVIIGLSKVRALRVISRASAMRLKDTPLSVREVGREYAVRYLVAGSVRRSGPRVRVSAEVIDTVLDTVAWSDRFDGAFDDPFALQEAVARGVATALHVRLTAADEARLLTHPVPDPRAADWIRRATSDVLSFTRDGIERAEALAAKAEEVCKSAA